MYHKNKLILIIAISIMVSFVKPVFCQSYDEVKEELLLKYWYYRDRLKHFVVPGEKRGEGDMAGIRNRMGEGGPLTNIDFGQNSVYNGYYLGTLATEYRLLMNGGNYSDAEKTEKQIVYALRFFYNYLDRCEHFWNSTNLNNGFFVRRDVPRDFLLSSSYNGYTSPNNQMFNGQRNHVDILNADLTSDASNFVGRSGNNPAHWGLDKPLPPGHPGWLTEDQQSIQGWTPIEDPAPQDPEFYMSQDEVIGYLMGLALIYKCMGDAQQTVPETSLNCKYTAQQYALLIIANICGGGNPDEVDHWKIHDPWTGNIQWDCWSFAYPYAAVGFWFSEGNIPTDHYFTNDYNECMARGGWNNYDTWLMGLTNFVMASTLAAIGSSWNSQVWFPPFCPIINGNNTEPTIINLLENYNIHTFYLLLYKILHPDIGFSNDPLPLSLSQLHSAPGEGPYKYGDDDHSGGGWAASYKWRNNLNDQNNGSTLGNFCGCDYMLFYNMYLLVTNRNYENYHYFDNYSCGNNWPYLDADGTTIIGDNNKPLGEYAFNRIESTSAILNSTRFNYRQEPISEIPGHPGNAIIKAENEIVLSPGFFAEKGSTLLAAIEPHIFWEDNFKKDNLILREHPQSKSMEINFEQQEETINSEMHDESLIIYPNPFENNIYIQNCVVGMSYAIKDMFNRTVSKGYFQSKSLCLNLSSLPSGMYILYLDNKQHPSNYKIVKL